MRLALAGKQAYFLPELLMEYRFHGGQTKRKSSPQTRRNCATSWGEQTAPSIPSLFNSDRSGSVISSAMSSIIL